MKLFENILSGNSATCTCAKITRLLKVEGILYFAHKINQYDTKRCWTIKCGFPLIKGYIQAGMFCSYKDLIDFETFIKIILPIIKQHFLIIKLTIINYFESNHKLKTQKTIISNWKEISCDAKNFNNINTRNILQYPVYFYFLDTLFSINKSVGYKISI